MAPPFTVIRDQTPTAEIPKGAVVAMGLAPVWPIAFLATALAGFCATWVGVSMQAAIQSDLPDSYRGRVMSLWVMTGIGGSALGALLLGALADVLGLGWAAAIVAAMAALPLSMVRARLT